MPSPERSVKPATRPASPAGTAWGKLLQAAGERFPAPEYEVTCDDRHTVWVKRTDGTRSLGLSQWLLRRYSLDELLDDAAAKLESVPQRTAV